MFDLPFTTQQFLDVFRDYNTAIWPVQIIAYLLGIISIFLPNQNKPQYSKVIGALLAGFWLWNGFSYHILFFSEINKAAYLFGGLFVIQGFLFLYAGLIQADLQFHFRSNIYGAVGGLFILYAMIIYPILGDNLGHAYPNSPMFGVAPCPTTIFTFGMLLWSTKNIPLWLLIIPGLWSIISFTAAIKLGILEDTGLLIAGITGVAMLLYRNYQQQ